MKQLTPQNTVLFEKVLVTHPAIEFIILMEPEGQLSYFQKPATVPYYKTMRH